MDLKWTPPMSDGGAKVIGYVIEKRDITSSIWHRVNDYNLPDLQYTVSDLTENRDYEFHVRAVNSAGAGDPSPANNPVKERIYFVKFA